METISGNVLTAYGFKLEPNETVFKVIYKHWGKFLWVGLGLGAISVLSLGLIILSLTSLVVQSVVAISFTIAWFAVIMIYGLSEWRAYKMSAILITNQRIIDCQQLNLFTRRVQTIDIYEVQSCSGEQTGVLGVLFNYGNVWINTIGDRPIVIHFIPEPETVSGNIMNYHNLLTHIQPGQVVHSNSQTLNTLHHHYDQQQPEVIRDESAIYQPVKAPPRPVLPIEPQTLVMFHIPSELIGDLMNDLPAQKEPYIEYLPRTDYYQVEIIVPADDVDRLIERLRRRGAEDITLTPVELIR